MHTHINFLFTLFSSKDLSSIADEKPTNRDARFFFFSTSTSTITATATTTSTTYTGMLQSNLSSTGIKDGKRIKILFQAYFTRSKNQQQDCAVVSIEYYQL